MGCCESTIKPPNLKSPERRAPLKLPDSNEEETVKEVVSSETHTNPNTEKPAPILNPNKLSSFNLAEPTKDLLADDSVSDATASSLSSTVTREYEGDAARLARRRPLPKQRTEWNAGPGRERITGRSPSRNEHSSPGRRASPRSNSGQLKAFQKGLSYTGEGREMLERRSRSPCGNRSARIERTPSKRLNRGSKSPDRVSVGGSGEKATHGKVEESSRRVEDGEEDESLDNPVVSLECFIFL